MRDAAHILGRMVFFLFPVPFAVSLGNSNSGAWTGYVAYAAAVILVAAAIATGWLAYRQSRRP
ncbi:MAG TPA: hypothetical protein VHT93_16455 [Pseudolabrys sp.]|jgi:hypothetical protein|nr:hypothetical protein [Pseudolabrys sp.]